MFGSDMFDKIVKEHIGTIKNNVSGNKFLVTLEQRSELSSDLAEIFGLYQEKDNKFCEHILSILDDKQKKPSNIQDAFIINTCIENRYTLVTDNKLFAETAWKYGARVNNLYEFLKAMNRFY